MILNLNACLYAIAFVVAVCNGTPTLTAELDYGTFEGSHSARYNLSYWQKIPFAAPPVGQNRFRGPQPPIPITNGTYNSTQAFDMCPQRTVNGSEDCLYLGLYSRPWTTGQPLRPVVVVFYGGGFIQGSAYFSIPPSGKCSALAGVDFVALKIGTYYLQAIPYSTFPILTTSFSSTQTTESMLLVFCRAKRLLKIQPLT